MWLCTGLHPETVKQLGDILGSDKSQSPETSQVGLAVDEGVWASCPRQYDPPCHVFFRKQSWWTPRPGSPTSMGPSLGRRETGPVLCCCSHEIGWGDSGAPGVSDGSQSLGWAHGPVPTGLSRVSPSLDSELHGSHAFCVSPL